MEGFVLAAAIVIAVIAAGVFLIAWITALIYGAIQIVRINRRINRDIEQTVRDIEQGTWTHERRDRRTRRE